jgi:hypothetical protein
MTLHSIPHQKGEYHGLSKPQAQNGDSVENVDGHRDPSGSGMVIIGLQFLRTHTHLYRLVMNVKRILVKISFLLCLYNLLYLIFNFQMGVRFYRAN